MKKRRRYEDYGTLGELTTTPLLDLAFILLIVFLIALPLLVNRPAATPAPTPEQAEATVSATPLPVELHVLEMAADRTMAWDGVPVGPEELGQILAGFESTACPVGLHVVLDPALGARDTTDLLDFLRPHGIAHVQISTLTQAPP